MRQPRLLLDGSGLIVLARLGLLERVDRMVDQLHVTPEVIAEVAHGDRPGARAVVDAVATGHVRVLEPVEVRPISGLGSGETATIRRAAELGMTAVIDDLDARRAAARTDVTLTGTIAILVRLSQSDDHVPILDLVDDLDRIGFRVSPAVRAWVLAQARPDPADV